MLTVLLIAAATLVLVPLLFFASLIRLDRPAAAVEARRAGPHSRFVTVDGLRVHVTDTGSGPPLVLLHGINASHLSFAGWQRELSADYRVIAIDLPGHGLTGPDPLKRYSWAEMAARIHGVVAALGLERFVLAGNSLGGAVALSYALAHPDRLRALVLIDSIGGPRTGPMPPALAALSRPGLGKLFSVMTPRAVVRQVLESTYGDPRKVTEADVDAYYDLTLRAGNRRAGRDVLLQGPDQGLAAHVPEIKVPTLIIWGEKDSWVGPRSADWFEQQIDGAVVARFPELGHLPMAEDPVATAEALRRFLASLQ